MSSTDKPERRNASVKETGEELPQDQWERFEAAVEAEKGKPEPSERPAARPGGDADQPRKRNPEG